MVRQRKDAQFSRRLLEYPPAHVDPSERPVLEERVDVDHLARETGYAGASKRSDSADRSRLQRSPRVRLDDEPELGDAPNRSRLASYGSHPGRIVVSFTCRATIPRLRATTRRRCAYRPGFCAYASSMRLNQRGACR